MVSGTGGKEPWQALYRSPQAAGFITQASAIFVDDVDLHYQSALEAGAKVVREPTTSDYGEQYWVDRSYGALDPEGHLWWFMQRIRSAPERAQ